MRLRNFSIGVYYSPKLLTEVPYVQQASELATKLFTSIKSRLYKAPSKVRGTITYDGCEAVLIRYKRHLENCLNSNYIFKDFYSIISDPHFLLYTCYLMQSRKLTFGMQDMPIGSITISGILKMSKELKSHSYLAKPVRRVLTDGHAGGSRLLGIASTKDIVVQYAVFVLLDPYLDRLFIKDSYGFRRNKTTHTCLDAMSREWKWVA